MWLEKVFCVGSGTQREWRVTDCLRMCTNGIESNSVNHIVEEDKMQVHTAGFIADGDQNR